ncbi:hypothetical protein A6U86_32805 [Rhizobium sp. AC27/96]|uniref:hypothetical protein n=1 Tax=Rhizobium TaxID=379 RepID=UPI0008284B95|nr:MULTISPECIES: hypothetical protein [Rhizobium]NTF46597.1 hypothetical protein [Rhizobium rhizogenes]OCI99613.1 hypothetical protein A6U86_32805 [Rhizobium sp. AC27/96]
MSISDAPGAIPVESSQSALTWGPIIGGAVAATGISLILLLLGSGVGLTMVSPWQGQSASIGSLAISSAIWLVIVQWLSSAFGGYLTGRLRTKWAAVHTDEVFFRDTAHGFISWALATLFVAGFIALSLTSLATTGTRAVGAAAATAATATSSVSSNGNLSVSYFTDALLRPGKSQQRAASDDNAAIAEISGILLNGAVQGQIPDEDKAYLASVVAARTGLSADEAKARVDTVLKRIDDAKVAAQKVADDARKSAATTALLGALSLLIGAFIASAAAALGGSQRDEEEDLIITGGLATPTSRRSVTG